MIDNAIDNFPTQSPMADNRKMHIECAVNKVTCYLVATFTVNQFKFK
jgi:hypothetical protein